MLLLAEIDGWEILGLCFAISPGVLFIGLSIPLIFDKIPPNQWYGFRTQKTLSNKEIWYKVNRFIARDLIVFGILHIALLVTYFIFFAYNRQMMNTNFNGPWILLIIPFPMVLGFSIVLYRSFRYLKKL